MAALNILQIVLLAGAFLLAWRRSRPASPPFHRELFGRLCLLIAAEFVVQSGGLRLFESFRIPGLVWLTQAGRAALLVAAVHVWFGIIKPQMGRVGKALLVLGSLAVAFGPVGLSFLGSALLFLVISRRPWPQELHGRYRLLALLLVPFLFIAVSVQIQTTATANPDILVTAAQTRPPLLIGNLSPAQMTELKLTRPLDGAVEAALALLRMQILVLFLKLLTLPVRLRGMSLKRRFMINYVFIRLIPGALSAILIGLIVYFGFGLTRISRVRSSFDETLNRAVNLAVQLSSPGGAAGRDTTASGDPAALESYRAWLAEDGAAASIAVLTAGADGRRVVRATPGTPAGLMSESLFTRADHDSAGRSGTTGTGSAFTAAWPDTAAGLVEAGGRLYLAARHRAGPNGAVIAEVAVPLDSTYLARVAARSGVDVTVTAFPGLFIGATTVRSGRDTSWTRSKYSIQATVERGVDRAHLAGKRLYLGRAFLAVGDWRHMNPGMFRGAVELKVETYPGRFSLSGPQLASIITTNIITIFILLGLLALIATTESLAVRTGRGIVQAILDEVLSLRDAVLRIGRGDLDYRIPVHGKDEIAALSGSVNEMAADLKRQQAELVEKERLEADLMVARQIQQRFLPQAPPVVPGLDVAGVSIPSREVGGDLFYFLPLEEGRLGLALGDVSGKSVPAALLMSNVLAALRTEARLHAEVNESLGRINELIVEQVEPGRFVTLFYGVVDGGRSEIRYSSAGHNPPLKVSAAGAVEWLDQSGVPLGVLPETSYAPSTTPFRSGDVLIVYSDGITEAMRDGGGNGSTPPPPGDNEDNMEFFDEERLVEAVLALRNAPASEIIAGILAAVNRFADGTPQADDMTVVVVKKS